MVFVLYQSCIPVKGASRATICDLQRSELYYIPLGLYEILTDYKNKTLNEILNIYGQDLKEIITGYFNYLEENELGFYTENPENFPPIELNWNVPAIISNAIVEIDTEIDTLDNTLSQLNKLFCKGIEFRFISPPSISFLDIVLTHLETTYVRSAYIITPFHESFDEKSMEIILLKHQRVSSITIHSFPEDRTPLNTKRIYITNDYLDYNKCCGEINKAYMSINLKSFTESVNYNSCLNQKISIDSEGKIKNCPSLDKVYGNIRDTSLIEAINNESFKKLWSITKDSIQVCQDCEYRHVCTDCRAFIENPKNLFSKPLKCGYNPYTTEWDEWSTNPLKEKAIKFYKLQEII